MERLLRPVDTTVKGQRVKISGIGNSFVALQLNPMLKNCDSSQREVAGMKKSDVICSECGAGFRRIELCSQTGERGEYRCPVCNSSLEVFDGSKLIVYRLTIQPCTRATRD